MDQPVERKPSEKTIAITAKVQSKARRMSTSTVRLNPNRRGQVAVNSADKKAAR
jgi:hypothetical protein